MRSTAVLVLVMAVARVSCAPLENRPPYQENPTIGTTWSTEVQERSQIHDSFVTLGPESRQLQVAAQSPSQEQGIRTLKRRFNKDVAVAVGRDAIIALIAGGVFTAALAAITAATGGNPFSRTWNPPVVTFSPNNSQPNTLPDVFVKPAFSGAAASEQKSDGGQAASTTGSGATTGKTPIVKQPN